MPTSMVVSQEHVTKASMPGTSAGSGMRGRLDGMAHLRVLDTILWLSTTMARLRCRHQFCLRGARSWTAKIYSGMDISNMVYGAS